MYTDGACSGNPGPGGWAWAVPGERYASGAELKSTNQRMEIAAVLEAVRTLEGPLDIHSDSTYVVNCFRDRWWEGWVNNGWRNKAKKPVANRDLWEPLIELYRLDTGRVLFKWVKGHSGDPNNDIVDRLAVEAALTQRGRAGHEWPPANLGAPDKVGGKPAAAERAEPEIPDGRKIVVVGHRPPELGGYDDATIGDRIKGKLTTIFEGRRLEHGAAVVLTGLGLGVEQLAAEAAVDAGVPFVGVLPYAGFDSRWPPATQTRFRRLLDAAATTITLQSKPPDSTQAAGRAMQRRDAWLFRHADEGVAVWDGEDALLGRVVRSLEDHVGRDEVMILQP